MEFWQDIKDYVYAVYLVAAGYLGWNHKRLDKVIVEHSRTVEKVKNLEEDVNYIRQGVDKLIYHLLDKKRK